MKRISPLPLRSLALVALTTVATVGCMSTVGSVKSTGAKDIVPTTDTKQKQLATLSMASGGPALNKQNPRLEIVALFPGPAQPVGIAISKSGRTFMSFPRWADPVKNTLVEWKGDQLVAFPDEQTNAFDGTDLKKYNPAEHFVSVQAIVFDDQDRLWVLDPGSFNFAPNILHAPKLVAYDINSGKRLKSIGFANDVALKMTTLNDVRFDLKRGPEGTAYITDSGVGGIIVVDLASGDSWRHLSGHPSVLPTPGLKQQSEGGPLMIRKANGEIDGPDLRSDGIALSPDGKTLYYTTVASRDVWSIATDLLVQHDPEKEPDVLAAVKKVATKPSGSDGILCDAKGRIYTTEFEDNAIRRTDPATGKSELIVQDARLVWPDTLTLHGNDMYVTSNQLARQPNFHFGKDLRQPPYALFRLKIDGDSKMASAE